MPNKRKKKALTILVVIIVIAVVVCYILPVAILGASAAETGVDPNPNPNAPQQTQENPGTEEFGTDDPALMPPPPEPPKPPATLTITSYPPTMEVGDRTQLQCILENAPEGTYAEWSSSNPNAAVVDPTGSIAAIAPGDAEITVRAGDFLRASALVHVNDYKASKITILVAGLIGEPDPRGRLVYKIKVGDVCHLTPRIDPNGAKLNSIAWTVSNPDVAELSEDGDFVALAKGQTSVTASSGALADTIFFDVEENGLPTETILRYIIIGAVVIAACAVGIVIAAGAAKRRKEEERQRAAAKRRKEEARQRDEEAARRAADEAELAAKIEKTKQVIEMETSTHRPAKVSGATVSAAGDASKPYDETTERPLTLDDVE